MDQARTTILRHHKDLLFKGNGDNILKILEFKAKINLQILTFKYTLKY